MCGVQHLFWEKEQQVIKENLKTRKLKINLLIIYLFFLHMSNSHSGAVFQVILSNSFSETIEQSDKKSLLLYRVSTNTMANQLQLKPLIK